MSNQSLDTDNRTKKFRARKKRPWRFGEPYLNPAGEGARGDDRTKYACLYGASNRMCFLKAE